MKAGVLATIIFGALIGYPIASFAGLAPDADGDGIPDVLDKCMNDSRNVAATCDRDLDGYGNVCDGDYNQDKSVLAADYAMFFVPALKKGTDSGRGEDMNCDGSVLAADYAMFFVPQLKKGSPGASGLSCAGTVPCQ